jgi:NTE family protein
MKKIKIGLALGGGGAKGLAHIGVLKVLEKNNIIPQYVAGASMGALIGAYYSLGFNLDYLEKQILSLDKKTMIRKFVDLNNPKISLIKGKKIEKYINFMIKNSQFQDLKNDFKIVSTDLATGQEIIFDKGDLTKALLSSISVPGILPPVKVNDQYLVDGGLVDNTPAKLVEKMGADFIIAVDLTIKQKTVLKDPGMFSVLMQSYEIMRSQGVESRLKNVRKKLVVIMPETRKTTDSFKFYNMARFIESGEKATEKVLPQILKKINL